MYYTFKFSLYANCLVDMQTSPKQRCIQSFSRCRFSDRRTNLQQFPSSLHSLQRNPTYLTWKKETHSAATAAAYYFSPVQ